jgi:hypothetical protein
MRYVSRYLKALCPGYWISNSGKPEKAPKDIMRNGIVGLQYADGSVKFFPEQKNEFKIANFDVKLCPKWLKDGIQHFVTPEGRTLSLSQKIKRFQEKNFLASQFPTKGGL